MLRSGLNHQIAGALALSAVASAGTAAPPVVDTDSPSPVTNVSREELEKLPTGRSVADLIATCPSQTIPTVAGGTPTLIDGVPTTPAPSIACIRPDDLRMIEVYNTHNSLRAEYGASPLVWNPVLAQGAQGYANQLAQTGRLVHASREGRGTVRENISQGLTDWSIGRHLGSWTGERQYFTPGNFPNVSITGDWYVVGHFSQMIWPTTTDIGCGISGGGNFSWFVCRYNPGGNKDGKPVGFPAQQVAMTGDGAGAGTGTAAQPFVNDRWRLNEHWSFNMGTRYEEAAPQTGQAPSLFDLGIYGGGAWSSDWFGNADADPVSAGTNLDLAAQQIADILLSGDNGPAVNHDYGYDGALFVGYDLGMLRLEPSPRYVVGSTSPSPRHVVGSTPTPPAPQLRAVVGATPPMPQLRGAAGSSPAIPISDRPPAQGQAQPDPFDRALIRLSDARNGAVFHRGAAGQCDADAMRRWQESLDRLARDARREAEAARAAGDFAQIDAHMAGLFAAEIQRLADEARSRECGTPVYAGGPGAATAENQQTNRLASVNSNINAGYAEAVKSYDEAAIRRALAEWQLLQQDIKRAIAEASKGRSFTPQLRRLAEIDGEVRRNIGSALNQIEVLSRL